MAQFFNDLFNSASLVDVTAHTSDSGHAWSLVKGTVSPKVFTNGAVANGATTTTTSLVRPSVISSTADTKTTATYHFDSLAVVSTLGIAARMSADGSAGYLAAYRTADKTWALYRLVATTDSSVVLATSAAITYVQGNEKVIVLSVEGTGATVTVKLTIDGVELLNYADTSTDRVVAAGYPGLSFKNGGAAGTTGWFNDMSADTLAVTVTVPPAPTVGTISAGDGVVTVPFTTNGDGGSAITSVTATWSGGQSASSATSPITITGVTNGTAGTAKVKATNAIGTGPESAASNSVTPSAAVTVSGVTVSPSAPSVTGGTTQQFTAIVAGTGAVPQGVTWSMTGAGSISASGLYTAPAATAGVQSATITATSTTDGTKSGSASVTVPAAVAITVSTVTVSPSAPSVIGAATQQFTATVSGTGTVPQGVTWSATLGTINASGLYTAPASTTSAQTATVTATSTQDTSKSGTATVTIPASGVAAPQNYSAERNPVYSDRVQDTTTTAGTGTITLANTSLKNRRTFGAAYTVGTKNIPYCIADETNGTWEHGLGTLVTTTTLSRDKVFASSSAGAKIDFVAVAKDVFCVPSAQAFSTFAVKDYIDLRDFDVDPTFTNDSQAGIQAAILAAYSKNISRIKCPDGRFKLAGTRTVSNAHLYIPTTSSTAPSRTIMFEGAAPPNLEMQGLVRMPITTNGTIFESVVVGNGGSSILRGEGPAATDPSGMRWNYTNVGFRNMGFRTKVDGGAGGAALANPMSALNLDFFAQIVELDNIRVDVNMPIIDSPNPSAVNSSAIIIPPINNHAQFNIGTVLVAGYTNGVVFNEHTVAKSITVLGCVNGVVLVAANHGSMIGHLLVECSKNSIAYQGNHALAITAYSTEHNTDGNWFDFVSDINYTATASTRKVVITQATVVASHVGIYDAGFTTNNAACYKVIVGAGAN